MCTRHRDYRRQITKLSSPATKLASAMPQRHNLTRHVPLLRTSSPLLARIIHERLRRLQKERAMNFVPDAPRPDTGGPS
jgi:hypothetical protein